MPSSHESSTAGLRRARFSPPRAPAVMVERARLVSQIDESNAQLTLICAPAGFGKSTLMQQLRRHLEARGLGTIWLAVEPADNDLGHLVQSLTTAVEGVLGGPAQSPTPGLYAISAKPSQGGAAELIERLSLSEMPVTLFLDDLELIVDREVWAFVQRLLANLDMHHRMVVASRVGPSLALGRMRAHGQLLELDHGELRFTPQETETFLARQNVGAPLIRALQQHTEGWPAVLQLAAVAIGGIRGADALRSISGTSDGIAEYLAQEILDSRSAPQRDFLLRSASLGQFCAELCDAALERSDSDEMIAQIMRDNLLLTPIDAQQRWYRYHPVLADFLRSRLAHGTKEDLIRLHRRAATWTAAHGFMSEAFTHALAADDQALAADLLEASAMDNLHSGRVADTARAIAMLPDTEVYRRPRLLRAAAFAAIFAHRYDAARRYMDIIQQIDDRAMKDDETVAMHLMLLGWTDSIPDLLGAVEELRAKANRFGQFTAGLVGNARAFCHIALGEYVEAERDLTQARQACEPIDALYVLSYSACFAAAIELNVGQLAVARAALETSFNRTIDGGQRYGSAGAVVATYLAECLYEANELDACQTLVDDYMPIVVETGLPDHLITLHRIAARLDFLRGHADAGHAVLVRLGEIGARRGLRRLTAVAWLERSYVALRNKDIESARRALANGRDMTLWKSIGAFNPHANEIDDVEIADFRMRLATGEGGQALPDVRAERQAAESAGRRRRALRLLFLESLALDAAGHCHDADAAFDQAVLRATENGMVRVLADESWIASSLALRSTLTGKPHIVALLRELGESPVPPTASERRDTSSAQAGKASRLTTREVQILRLVWKGSSNKAIARALFLSENTVETHLRRVFEKLGTRNRTQAAAVAHEAGVI
ncbi:LuxR C-terminal-related transcriptional regulator [Bradyrhizobium uaiense]|uniref:HTH luxR-type domain-containing protein n=1 Tax=Bradyrhizobium uaiense TaxID=2594946 RepID=A0A6P1BU25_9BRAD|nr:LuxR C-terminal-related transcriptional regulator [Bradyrhizobium uaiense]NEV01042.1 hypothetical protein [Bradyrhizobium uaiense]